MYPKEGARVAESWPCGMADTRTVVSGGSPIEIPQTTAPRPQSPETTELLRLVLPLQAKVKHTFLSNMPAMTATRVKTPITC